MIRVGTRGSALALAQATWVGERLGSGYELVTINAAGPVSDKSRWVSELERALPGGRDELGEHTIDRVRSTQPFQSRHREHQRIALAGGQFA